MNRWSLLAGCGVASHFLSALRSYFHIVYEVDMVPDTVLLCEHSPDKQLHLIEQLSPPYLISEAKELTTDAAKNHMTGQVEPILPFFVLDGWWLPLPIAEPLV